MMGLYIVPFLFNLYVESVCVCVCVYVRALVC